MCFLQSKQKTAGYPLLEVAGELRYHFSGHIGNATSSNPIDLAKEVVAKIPVKDVCVSFCVIIYFQGFRQCSGFVYKDKTHGIIKINSIDAKTIVVSLRDGEYKVVGA